MSQILNDSEESIEVSRELPGVEGGIPAMCCEEWMVDVFIEEHGKEQEELRDKSRIRAKESRIERVVNERKRPKVMCEGDRSL